MKLKTSVLLVACIFAFACLAAQGQERITANVPFGFTAGNMEAFAGEYDFSRQFAFDRSTVRITNAIGSEESFVDFIMTTPLTAQAGTPKLVFRVYGTRYFLSEVWFSGSEGVSFSVSKAESEIARNWQKEPETTIVLARK